MGDINPIATGTNTYIPTISGQDNAAAPKKKNELKVSGDIFGLLNTGKNTSFSLGVSKFEVQYWHAYLGLSGALSFPEKPYAYQSTVERVNKIPEGPAHVLLDGTLGLGFRDEEKNHLFSFSFGFVDRFIQKGFPSFYPFDLFHKTEKPLGFVLSAGDAKANLNANVYLAEPAWSLPRDTFNLSFDPAKTSYALGANLNKHFELDKNNTLIPSLTIEVSKFPEAGSAVTNNIIPSTMGVNIQWVANNLFGALPDFYFKPAVGFESTVAKQSSVSNNYFNSTTWDMGIEVGHTFKPSSNFSISPFIYGGLKLEDSTYMEIDEFYTKYRAGQALLGVNMSFGEDKKNGTLSIAGGYRGNNLERTSPKYNILTDTTTYEVKPKEESGNWSLSVMYSVAIGKLFGTKK